MKKPKVSIIVPIYNVSKYLEKCLLSIVAQTLKDIEIILINDCSPDPKDEKICLNFSTKDERIVYVNHEKNIGAGGARNTGIKLAKSEYIAFADPDDYVEPNMLKEVYDSAIDNNSDIVAFGYSFVDGDGHLISTSLPDYISEENRLKCYLENKNTLTPMIWDKLWKKSLFTMNNIFFPLDVYFQDMMIMPQLLYHADKISVLHEVYYFYLKREGSTQLTISKKHIDDAFFTYEYIAKFLKNVRSFEENKKLLEKRIMRMMQHHIENCMNNVSQHDRETILDYIAKKITSERPNDLKYYFPHRYFHS